MNFTRREFGKLALAGVPSLGALSLGTFSGGAARAAAAPGSNVSYIGGVQFGLQPFCYHDLPMNTDNRSILVQRMVQNGLGMVELHATWFEPRFGGPGSSPADSRDTDAGPAAGVRHGRRAVVLHPTRRSAGSGRPNSGPAAVCPRRAAHR